MCSYQSKEIIDMGVIGLSIAAITMSFGLIFLFCELGEQLSTRSSEIDDAIWELDWNAFPLHVQQMLPTILLITQHPIQLIAYGGIPCTRDNFKKVCFELKKIYFKFLRYTKIIITNLMNLWIICAKTEKTYYNLRSDCVIFVYSYTRT